MPPLICTAAITVTVCAPMTPPRTVGSAAMPGRSAKAPMERMVAAWGGGERAPASAAIMAPVATTHHAQNARSSARFSIVGFAEGAWSRAI